MFEQEVANLLGWILAWNNNGAYYGPVVHRLNTARLFRIHETAWTQSALLQGFLNLCDKSSGRPFLANAVQIAKTELAKYDRKKHHYKYAGHEDDRFTSLVHCALMNCALLRLYRYVDGSFQKNIINTVTDNVRHYFIDTLWDGTFGAFTIAKKDYQFKDEKRFILNMNAVALKNLVLLKQIDNSDPLDTYMDKVLNWICSQAISSDNELIDGAIPYQRSAQDTRSVNCVSIYSGLTLSSLCSVYEVMQSYKLKTVISGLARHCAGFYDSETGLFFHTYTDRLKKYPQFIAGSALVLRGLWGAETLCSLSLYCLEKTKRIVSYRYKNGAFPNFYGYHSLDNKRKPITGRDNKYHYPVLEDNYPTINWNAFMFEYLSGLTNKEITTTKPKTYCAINQFHGFLDTAHFSMVASLWPVRSFALLFYCKKFKFSLFNISYYSLKNLIIKEFIKLISWS